MPDDRQPRRNPSATHPFAVFMSAIPRPKKAAAKNDPAPRKAPAAKPATLAKPSGISRAAIGGKPSGSSPAPRARASFAHLRTGADARRDAEAAEERSRARAARTAAPPEPSFAERAELAARKQCGEAIDPKPGTFGARVLATMKKLGR
ncbi:hypothetical protein [Sphingomonas sp. BE137]|uniref:hypothetical protein n=1 Tax=Sphingomonas sp. BE137 TaxID=2817844 RepID=UPI001AE65318|nr:hypothetical protein [Sphingomonas sp. BE137]MDR6850350.1 hypothetical protein [Sphingomonas sp. BE137]